MFPTVNVWRPFLGQYPKLFEQDERRTVEQLLMDSLERRVRIYADVPLDQATATRLSEEAARCVDLISKVRTANDLAAARSAAERCIEDFTNSMQRAADESRAKLTTQSREDFNYSLLGIGLVAALSVGVSAYHGYKRNHDSVGWAFWWGFMGLLFPILTPVVAIAQGYGKRER